MKFYWIVLLVYTAAKAQPVSQQECLSTLRQAYKDSREQMEKRKDGVLHLEFSTKTVMREAYGGESREVSVTLLSNEYFSLLRSDELNVFQDTTTTVNIIPDKKLLYILNGTHLKSRNIVAGQISLFQDSLFHSSEVLYCNKLTRNGIPTQKIGIALHDKNKKRYKIEKLEYLLEDDELKNIKIWFTPESPVKVTEITYKKVDFSSQQVVNENVLSYVFDHGNTLKKEYQNYKVIDTRNTH